MRNEKNPYLWNLMVWIVIIIIIQAVDAYQDHHIHEYLREQDYRILQMIDSQMDMMERLGEYLESLGD